MTQKNTTFTVVTKDAHGTLRSSIIASRADLVVNLEPMRYEGDVPLDRSPVEERGVAVKVTISPLQPGDFVVRSVLNGRRRKFEVLAGAVPSASVASLCQFADIPENHFIVPASAVSEEGVVAISGLEARQQFAAGIAPEGEDDSNEGDAAQREERVIAFNLAKLRVVNDVVVLTDGAAVVEFPGAVRVN